jgi:hypothetical protein
MTFKIWINDKQRQLLAEASAELALQPNIIIKRCVLRLMLLQSVEVIPWYEQLPLERTNVILIGLNNDIWKWLQQTADKHELSRTAVIFTAIRQFLPILLEENNSEK